VLIKNMQTTKENEKFIEILY
jgi:hypothetical protein